MAPAASLVRLEIESDPSVVLALTDGVATDTNQPKPIGHHISVIEVKKRGSSTTTRGNALDLTTMEANMAIPPLLTLIEEEDGYLHCWVDRSKV